jgi:hypothetical protein
VTDPRATTLLFLPVGVDQEKVNTALRRVMTEEMDAAMRALDAAAQALYYFVNNQRSLTTGYGALFNGTGAHLERILDAWDAYKVAYDRTMQVLAAIAPSSDKEE